MQHQTKDPLQNPSRWYATLQLPKPISHNAPRTNTARSTLVTECHQLPCEWLRSWNLPIVKKTIDACLVVANSGDNSDMGAQLYIFARAIPP